MTSHSRNKRVMITLDHPKYKAKFTFGNDQDRVKLISNLHQIDEIYFYGFKGEINSPLFETIHTRPESLQAELIQEFLRSIKFSLLKKVLSLADHSPELVYRYRYVFVRIANDEDFGTRSDRTEIGDQIPVLLLGVGWKTINHLHNKNVFVEVLTTNIPSIKAERASSMGYNVVCAWTQTEQVLLEKMLGAKNLKLLPDAKLRNITSIISPNGELKPLIHDEGEIDRSLDSDDLNMVNYSNETYDL